MKTFVKSTVTIVLQLLDLRGYYKIKKKKLKGLLNQRRQHDD